EILPPHRVQQAVSLVDRGEFLRRALLHLACTNVEDRGGAISWKRQLREERYRRRSPEGDDRSNERASDGPEPRGAPTRSRLRGRARGALIRRGGLSRRSKRH